ncbi:hypothetical protein ACWGJ2_19635 [Streptomyces sp. NPDC054796]
MIVTLQPLCLRCTVPSGADASATDGLVTVDDAPELDEDDTEAE